MTENLKIIKTTELNEQAKQQVLFNCKDQEEVDYYWNALTSNGGEESNCGWCKDKYGLSWQVVPVEYFSLINHSDPEVRAKAMKNTMKQKKLILADLK
jgi:predicted 3-demethylubiquinone-9 3-methyltransferase (glyoxalase superfamily)